tara:strand:+ start:165 stop:1073 length:909 start_codon:yes stop_codon:yes gene_type:complete
MKKRGRKKKEENCSGVGGVEIKAETEEQKRISFGKSGGTQDQVVQDNKRNLMFGGLNITIHSAKKTDVAEVAKSLRFGSITADTNNSGKTNVEYGKIPEKNSSIRSMPSRMCEIVEHNSDEEPTDEPAAVPPPPPLQVSSFTKETTRPKHKSDLLNKIFEQHGNQELPTSTKLWCWWCFHPFCTTPCFLPTVHDEYRKRYVVVGNFCSWNCVKAYNIDQGDSQISKRNDIIRVILRKLGIRSETIKAAPPRATLKELGGPLDITAFRKAGGEYIQNKKLSSLTIAIEPSKMIRKKEMVLVGR